MRAYTWALLIILAMLLAYEWVGWRSPDLGDLISEQVWWIRDNAPYLATAFFGLWGWLTYHFYAGQPGEYGWPDLAAVAVGAGVYWWVA